MKKGIKRLKIKIKDESYIKGENSQKIKQNISEGWEKCGFHTLVFKRTIMNGVEEYMKNKAEKILKSKCEKRKKKIKRKIGKSKMRDK